MDKTIELLIAASVVLVAGLIVITMGTGSLDEISSDSEDIQNQGCSFQQQRALQNPDFYDRMSEECKTDSFEQQYSGS